MSTDTVVDKGLDKLVLDALQVNFLNKSFLVSLSNRSVFVTCCGAVMSTWLSKRVDPSHQVMCGGGEPPMDLHRRSNASPSLYGPTVLRASLPTCVRIVNFRGGTAK